MFRCVQFACFFLEKTKSTLYPLFSSTYSYRLTVIGINTRNRVSITRRMVKTLFKELVTEQLICSKLIEMMQKEPFYKIHVTDLVRELDIGRSTFYTYFDSIFSVLQKIEDDIFKHFEKKDDSIHQVITSPDKLTEYISMFSITTLKEDAFAISVLLGENGDPAFQARYIRYLRKTIVNFWKIRNVKIPCEYYDFVLEYMTGATFFSTKWLLNNINKVTEEYMIGFYKMMNTNLAEYASFHLNIEKIL